MHSDQALLHQQRRQHVHDLRNHSDVWTLPKAERLKHYGLHFAKYVGRLARAPEDASVIERTLVDAALVSLSAANALGFRLLAGSPAYAKPAWTVLADQAGRFADACQRVDHLQDCRSDAVSANAEIMAWVVAVAKEHGLDLVAAMDVRRQALAKRAFFA